ncbi:hypothetical protein ICN48_05500 [Polynucleobacter sp. JS-Safj-400b-B2]|uniref:hypothetical protein n=1 Tax=Polynucleobacter sp. JS-Safj-400b-B2 TaxID=2576921 RepID=UPI001C0E298E|nr:hypothetical protein [Polynucleobacter sp. JS-Safj-400b-B2]MBU3625689.1 hypothetical protein [Polynucleobacter sp. JS-Safj-400b-B2]
MTLEDIAKKFGLIKADPYYPGGYVENDFPPEGFIKLEALAKLIIEECHDLFIIRGIDNIDIAMEQFGIKASEK